MSFDALSPCGLDYLPCRYGRSKVLFRGPRRSLDKPYVAFFGGTTTYGKYVASPFSDLIETEIETTCPNLGCLNAGIDVYATDPFLLDLANNACVTVLQVTSPRNISNRFYRVHPRRNDRFVEASALLRIIYRDVDFAEFNFVNHMLKRLQLVSPDRFQTVVDELQAAWSARMRLVLSQMPGKVILLWASAHEPPETALEIDTDPAFLTRSMIDGLRPFVTDCVEVVASPDALAAGTEGMVFATMDQAAAQTMLGPQLHREVANALVPVLRHFI
ncbi:DUF6473 family protein [Tateyamaria pelophila]|uniref:DUF6473 family protein n=1 Tax=Tateyamaria pelophila TaxID=328415 RepID=UPI001CBCE5ED|nr:DUF6473 family protein [Tateyamaria pelophila]